MQTHSDKCLKGSLPLVGECWCRTSGWSSALSKQSCREEAEHWMSFENQSVWSNLWTANRVLVAFQPLRCVAQTANISTTRHMWGAGLEHPPLLMSLHGPVYNRSTLRFNSELVQSFTVVSVLLKVSEYLYFHVYSWTPGVAWTNSISPFMDC